MCAVVPFKRTLACKALAATVLANVGSIPGACGKRCSLYRKKWDGCHLLIQSAKGQCEQTVRSVRF